MNTGSKNTGNIDTLQQQPSLQSNKNVGINQPILVPEVLSTRNVQKVSRIKQKDRYRLRCQYDNQISSDPIIKQSFYKDWPPVHLGKNFPISAGKCSSYDSSDCIRTGIVVPARIKDTGVVSERCGECIESTEDGASDTSGLDYQTFTKYEHQNKIDLNLTSHKQKKNNGASSTGHFHSESTLDVLNRSDVSPDSGIQSFPGTPIRNESPSHLLLPISDNNQVDGSQILSATHINQCISAVPKPNSLSQQTTTTINTITTTSTTTQVTLSSISCDLNRQICDTRTTSSASDSKHMGRRRGRGRPPKRAKNSWILQNKKSLIYAHLYAEARDTDVIERTPFSNITLPEHIQTNNHTKDVNEFPFCQQVVSPKTIEKNYQSDIVSKSLSSYQSSRFQHEDGNISPTRENKQAVSDDCLSIKKVTKGKIPSVEPFVQSTKTSLFEKNKNVNLSCSSKVSSFIEAKSDNNSKAYENVSFFDKFDIHSNGKPSTMLYTKVGSIANTNKTPGLSSCLVDLFDFEETHDNHTCLNRTSESSLTDKGNDLTSSVDASDTSYLTHLDNVHMEISSNLSCAKKQDKLPCYKNIDGQNLAPNTDQSTCQPLANSSLTKYSNDISAYRFDSYVKTVDVSSNKEKVELTCKKMINLSESKKSDSAFEKSYSPQHFIKLDNIPSLQKADFDNHKSMKDSLIANSIGDSFPSRVYEDSPPVLMKAEDLPCSEKVKDPPRLEEYGLPLINRKPESRRKKSENLSKFKKAEKHYVPIKQDLARPRTENFVSRNIENGRISESYGFSKQEKAEPVNEMINKSFVKKLDPKMKDEQIQSIKERNGDAKETEESKKFKSSKASISSKKYNFNVVAQKTEICIMQQNRKNSLKKADETIQAKKVDISFVSKNAENTLVPLSSIVSRSESLSSKKQSSILPQCQQKLQLKQLKQLQREKQKSPQQLQQKQKFHLQKQKDTLLLQQKQKQPYLLQQRRHSPQLQKQKPPPLLQQQKQPPQLQEQKHLVQLQKQKHPPQLKQQTHPPQFQGEKHASQEQPPQLQHQKQLLQLQQQLPPQLQLVEQPNQLQQQPPKLLQQPPQLQQVVPQPKLLEQHLPPFKPQDQLPPQLYQQRPSTTQVVKLQRSSLQQKESQLTHLKQLQQSVAQVTKPKKRADSAIPERSKEMSLVKQVKSFSKKSINNHVYHTDSKVPILNQQPISNMIEPVKKSEESSETKSIDRLCNKTFVEEPETGNSGTSENNIEGSKVTKIKDDIVVKRGRDTLLDNVSSRSEEHFDSFISPKEVQNDISYVKADNIKDLQKLKKVKKHPKLQKEHLSGKQNTSEELLKLAEEHFLNAKYAQQTSKPPKIENTNKIKRTSLVKHKKTEIRTNFRNKDESFPGIVADSCIRKTIDDSKSELHPSNRSANYLFNKSNNMNGLLNGNKIRRKPGRPKGSKNKTLLIKSVTSQKLTTSMFEQPENDLIQNNIPHDSLISCKLNQKTSRNSLIGSNHGLSTSVKRPRGRPRKHPTANALQPLENKRLRHLEDVTQNGLESENLEPSETKRRPGLGQKLPSEEGDFDSLIRSVHDSIKSQFHGQDETEDFNDFSLTDNLDTIEPTLVNVCIQQEPKPTRVVPKIRRPKLHVMMRRPRRGRRKKKNVTSTGHQSFLRSSFSSSVNLSSKAPFSSFSSNNIHLNQPSFSSDGNSFSSFASTSTTISKSGFHSQSFKKFTRQCANRKLISKKKKKRMLYFRSKHKNIVDPVFLADLDVIIGQFDSLIISESLEHIRRFSINDKPMPSIFRLAKIISNKKKKKEKQLTYLQQPNCHFPHDDLQCQFSSQVSPAHNQQQSFHHLTDKSKKVKLRKELKERRQKDSGERKNKEPVERMTKEHLLKVGLREPLIKNRRDSLEKVNKDSRYADRVRKGSSLERVHKGSSLERVHKGLSLERVCKRSSLDRVRKGSSLDRVRKGSSLDRVRKGSSLDRVRKGSSLDRVRKGSSLDRVRRGSSLDRVLHRGSSLDGVLHRGSSLDGVLHRGSSLDRVRRGSSLDRVRRGSSMDRVCKGPSMDKSCKVVDANHLDRNTSERLSSDIKSLKSYVKAFNDSVDKTVILDDNKISGMGAQIESFKIRDSESIEKVPEKSFAKTHRKLPSTPKSDTPLEKSNDKQLEGVYEKSIEKALENTNISFEKEDNFRNVDEKINQNTSDIHDNDIVGDAFREKFSQESFEKTRKEYLEKKRKDSIEKNRKEPGEKFRKELGEKIYKEKSKIICRKSASEENLYQSGEELKLSNQQCLPPKKRHKLFSSVQSSAEGNCNITNGKPDLVLQCIKTPEKRKVGRPRKHPLPFEEIPSAVSGE